jgi:malate dehydrogenase (oxaloacetate-decarboxylating)(NADP+)
VIGNKARNAPKRIVFAEAENINILKAAQIISDEGIGYPILLGDEKIICSLSSDNSIDISNMPIFDPRSEKEKLQLKKYAEIFYTKRARKGFTRDESYKIMKNRDHFGCMMVECGDADCMISGLTKKYKDTLRPALQIIGTEEGVNKVAGMYLLMTKIGPLFLADTTVNYNPTAEELAEIVILTANGVKALNIKPRIAMLSYSNFGSSNTPEAKLVAKAREIVKQKEPSLIVDGEMQSNLALDNELLSELYPFSNLVGEEVNTLIFPNLVSGNIAYNLLKEIGSTDAIGPIVLGLKKPVHVLQLGSTVTNIVNMAMIAVIDAQIKNKQLDNRSKKQLLKEKSKNN